MWLKIAGMQTDTAKAALERAFRQAGTRTRLAEQLGITLQAVSQWKICPANRVLQVERITGVPKHELRPDYYPPENHGEAA